MRAIVEEAATHHSPDSLAATLRHEPGLVLLRTGSFDVPSARYSFVTARPVLTFRSSGSGCSTRFADGRVVEQFGDPWQHLAPLLASFELLDEVDVPFPLGGCFGYWGYDLKNFVEPRLPRRAVNDLELPDCHLGFYPSLVVFDHQLGKAWIVATGLDAEGDRSEARARSQLMWWREKLADGPTEQSSSSVPPACEASPTELLAGGLRSLASSLSRPEYLAAVARALRYIHAGDIYQVNLAQRLAAPCPFSGWDYFERLTAASPAPFSAYLGCGDFALVSSSPELFLRLSGGHILTRPIKGTRPRDDDAVRDAQLAWELQRSEKENAELVMITDLLRNDLGRVCDFGSVRVPDLARLERFAQVQHLVSTVEGRLRDGVTHLDALAACFPGGSITGAPKIRAMEIIDELEPSRRGLYAGGVGYFGADGGMDTCIALRTALVKDGTMYVQAGCGVVADSNPVAEEEECHQKARALFRAAEEAVRFAAGKR